MTITLTTPDTSTAEVVPPPAAEVLSLTEVRQRLAADLNDAWPVVLSAEYYEVDTNAAREALGHIAQALHELERGQQ